MPLAAYSGEKWRLVEPKGGLLPESPRLSGLVEHALDEKGRLIVPARFRERLGAGFVLTIARPDPCLALYPSGVWTEFCARLEAAPRKDDSFRRMVRSIFAHTEDVGCDAQGRILIPAPLRVYAGIDRDVVSVGALTRVEIWARERFNEHSEPHGEIDLFGDLGLS